MEGVHVVGPGQEVWGRKPASGVQGKIPGRWSGDPEVEAKCEISVRFLTFSCRKFRNNEYKSRAWTAYFANTQFKKILKIQ